MNNEHDIEAVRQTNGLVALVIDRGESIMASVRITREKARELGKELIKAAGSAMPEALTHHGRTLDYTIADDAGEPLGPEDKAILKEIKPKRKLVEGTPEIKEAEKPEEKPDCFKCGKPMGKRIFRDSKGHICHRYCR